MLPIVERELRVRSRSRRTYWHRLTAALLSCGVSVLVLLLASVNSAPGQYGRFLFSILSWPAFLVCLLEGARVTSGCLSEEKQQGTLGLLFLTELSSADIVLGKLAGVALNSVYALLAILPALALPLLLGGITGGEFWRLVLALLLTLAFSLSIGLLVSAWMEDVTDSWLWTATLIGAIALLLPMLNAGISRWGFSLPDLGPGPAMADLQAGVYERDAAPYWWSMSSTLALTLASLAGACGVLPYRWQSREDTGRESKHRRVTAARRTAILNRTPMRWLGMYQGSGPDTLTLPIIGLVAIAMVVESRSEGLSSDVVLVGVAVAVILHAILIGWQGLRAVRMGSDLRASGAGELLLITPLQPQEIVLGMGRGLLAQAIRPGLVLTLGEMLMLGEAYYLAYAGGTKEWGNLFFFTWMFPAFAISAFIDLYGATYMGLYQGLIRPKRSAAVGWTVFWVQLFPLAFYTCCFYVGPLLSLIRSLNVTLWSRDRLLFEFPRLIRSAYEQPAASPERGSQPPPLDQLPRVIPPGNGK